MCPFVVELGGLKLALLRHGPTNGKCGRAHPGHTDIALERKADMR